VRRSAHPGSPLLETFPAADKLSTTGRFSLFVTHLGERRVARRDPVPPCLVAWSFQIMRAAATPIHRGADA
jgi:hypothetical protein